MCHIWFIVKENPFFLLCYCIFQGILDMPAHTSELGRYPVFLNELMASISYEWHLGHRAPSDSLAGVALGEMESWAEQGCACWLARVKSICNLLNIKPLHDQLYGVKTICLRGFSC